MSLIYIARSPSQKVYIGKTSKSLEERREKHWQHVIEGSTTHFHNALRKYGLEAFEWQVLKECDEVELDKQEQHFIVEFESFNPMKGYNMTFGGEGGKRTLETRKKMSEAHLGRPCPPEVAKKIGDAQRGEKARMFGKRHTEQTKQKMSDSQKKSSYWRGKTIPDDVKCRISETLKRRHARRNDT